MVGLKESVHIVMTLMILYMSISILKDLNCHLLIAKIVLSSMCFIWFYSKIKKLLEAEYYCKSIPDDKVYYDKYKTVLSLNYITMLKICVNTHRYNDEFMKAYFDIELKKCPKCMKMAFISNGEIEMCTNSECERL